MTNEEKAREIADNFHNYYVIECKEFPHDRSYDDYEKSALAMAEWKDKEFESILNIALETIGEQNGSCSEDVFAYQQKIRELLRDSNNQ